MYYKYTGKHTCITDKFYTLLEAKALNIDIKSGIYNYTLNSWQLRYNKK